MGRAEAVAWPQCSRRSRPLRSMAGLNAAAGAEMGAAGPQAVSLTGRGEPRSRARRRTRRARSIWPVRACAAAVTGCTAPGCSVPLAADASALRAACVPGNVPRTHLHLGSPPRRAAPPNPPCPSALSFFSSGVRAQSSADRAGSRSSRRSRRPARCTRAAATRIAGPAEQTGASRARAATGGAPSRLRGRRGARRRGRRRARLGLQGLPAVNRLRRARPTLSNTPREEQDAGSSARSWPSRLLRLLLVCPMAVVTARLFVGQRGQLRARSSSRLCRSRLSILAALPRRAVPVSASRRSAAGSAAASAAPIRPPSRPSPRQRRSRTAARRLYQAPRVSSRRASPT